jgi:hypothetical protein
LETAEMWCWSRKEHICWTDSVENEVLHSQWGMEYSTCNKKE